MEDPVTTPYGDTFDKKHLLLWLKQDNLCPLSRRPIHIKDLIQNKALNDVIIYYRKLNLLPENKNNEEKEEKEIMNISKQTSSYYSGVLEPLEFPLQVNFNFITSDHYRIIVQSAYNTINSLNEWDFIRRYKPSDETGYLFDNNPRIQNILTHIDNNYGGHSGTSMGISIRTIQKIASIGFEEFKRTFNPALV